jgi:hypothetical protein
MVGDDVRESCSLPLPVMCRPSQEERPQKRLKRVWGSPHHAVPILRWLPMRLPTCENLFD